MRGSAGDARLASVGLELMGIGMRLETVWKGLENLRGVEVTGGDGSNARKRGKCQDDGTNGIQRMVFVLKTGKYGLKMIFIAKIVG